MHTVMMMAQAAGQSSGLAGGNSMFMISMILMAGLFYVMILRPQNRKEKERQKTISEIRAGQRVMFGGGLIGTVSEVREHTFLVEVAPKLSIEIVRGSVSRVLQSDETPVLDDRK